MQYQRPIAMADHPIATKKYIVPTPSIDGLVARVKKIVRLRTPGGIIYALPRYGKTYGIRYVIAELRADYPDAVCISFGCEKKKTSSEDAFFLQLARGCGPPRRGPWLGHEKASAVDRTHLRTG